MTTTETAVATHTYRIYIDATPAEVTTTEKAVATHTYSIYIACHARGGLDAITNRSPDGPLRLRAARRSTTCAPAAPSSCARSDAMREHGAPDVILDGEVIEAEAPHRLVQTWNPLFGPPVTDEPATRLTWDIREDGYGGTKLTVTHELDGAPVTAGLVTGEDEMGGGGWAFMLSDLKTLLETGTSFAAP